MHLMIQTVIYLKCHEHGFQTSFFPSRVPPLRGDTGGPKSKDESGGESGRHDGKSMGRMEMLGMWQSGEKPDSSDGKGGKRRLLEVH